MEAINSVAIAITALAVWIITAAAYRVISRKQIKAARIEAREDSRHENDAIKHALEISHIETMQARRERDYARAAESNLKLALPAAQTRAKVADRLTLKIASIVGAGEWNRPVDLLTLIAKTFSESGYVDPSMMSNNALYLRKAKETLADESFAELTQAISEPGGTESERKFATGATEAEREAAIEATRNRTIIEDARAVHLRLRRELADLGTALSGSGIDGFEETPF